MLPTLAFGFFASLLASQNGSDSDSGNKDGKIRVRSQKQNTDALLDVKFFAGFGKLFIQLKCLLRCIYSNGLFIYSMFLAH